MANKLTALPRPVGQKDHYKFFKNIATKQDWKVKLTALEAHAPAVVSEVPLAPANFALSVSASPVDATGKALKDAEGRSIVTDSWTHTFTESEMIQPGFDPEVRMMEVIEQRIEAGEARVAAETKLNNFVSKWKK